MNYIYFGCTVTFEEQIVNLCEEAAACKSEIDAVALTRRAQALMRARVDELRSNLKTLQQLAPTEIITPDTQRK